MTEPKGEEKGTPIQYEIVRPTIEDIPQLLDLWREQYEYHHGIDRPNVLCSLFRNA